MARGLCRYAVLLCVPLALEHVARPVWAGESDAVIVLDERSVRVADSGRAETVLHKVVQVNTPRGRELFSQARFRYDPTTTTIRISRLARLTPAAGGQWREQLFDPLAATEIEAPQGGLRTLILRLPYASAGERIDYTAERRETPPFEGHFSTVMPFAGVVPVADARLEVRAPPGMKLYDRSWGCSTEKRASREEGDVCYTWTLRPGAGPAASAARVFVSTERDWERTGRWARQLYIRASQPTPTVRVAAARNHLSEGAPRERLQRALDYVRQSIRDSSAPSGASPTAPTDAETTVRLGQGDCKAKAALLIALLAEAGITGSPVLLDLESGVPLDQQLPSPYVFSHCGVKVQIDARSVWIDPTTTPPPYPSFAGAHPLGLVVPLHGGRPTLERFEPEE